MDWSILKPPLSVTPTTRRRGVALSRAKANFAAIAVWYVISCSEYYYLFMLWMRSGRGEWVAGVLTLIPFILTFNLLQALSVLFDKPATKTEPAKLSQEQKHSLTPRKNTKIDNFNGDIPLTPGDSYKPNLNNSLNSSFNSATFNRSTTNSNTLDTPQKLYQQRHRNVNL